MPPLILRVRELLEAILVLPPIVMVPLLEVKVTAPPFRFNVLRLVLAPPVCWRVRVPEPFGAMAMVPPPVVMAAVEPEVVPRFIVSAFPLAPESMDMLDAPPLAEMLAPLVKLRVGELMVRAAALPIVCVVPPNDMEAPEA